MFELSAFRLLSLIFSLSFQLIFIETSDDNIVSATIKSGIINGKQKVSLDGRLLHVFKGIPYAEPPVGHMRFKKALPVQPWSRAINAFESGNQCNQAPNKFEALEPDLRFNYSEDCLYLNIWTPIESEKNDVLKPVMVYIHGGALIMSATSEDFFGGEAIAAKGDVVVVTLNYRLNVFGFLYTGTDDAPGNVGLLDQTLALEWVNDNIRYFGGDSNQITIFGESAGGWCVSLHLLSPVSRNLFKNAFISAGAYTDSLMDKTPEDTVKKWLRGAELIGCTDEENDNKFTQKIIECLRSISTEKLIEIAVNRELVDTSIKAFPVVSVDREFLPKKPSEMLSSGDFKQNVNLLISTTEDEGSFLLAYFNDFNKYHPTHPMNLTFSESYKELYQISSGLSTHLAINGEEVAKLYFTGLSDNNDSDLLRRTIGIAVGDYYLLCPTTEFAKQVFKYSQYRSNVFQYLYTANTTPMFPMSWSGVSDCAGHFPMFGLPFLLPDRYSDREREISEQMIQFITDFVKTGTPSHQNGAEWPKYYAIDDNIIAPYYEIATEPKPKTNFNIGYKINECEYLWRKYLFENCCKD